jgi:hypothetical protein
MCVMCGSILFFCAGGRKNKINSLQKAPPYQRRAKPVNSFFVIIPIFLTRVNVSRSAFYTCIQRSTICGVLVPDDRRGWRCFCPSFNHVLNMNLQIVFQMVYGYSAKVCAKEYYIYRLLEKCKAVVHFKEIFMIFIYIFAC